MWGAHRTGTTPIQLGLWCLRNVPPPRALAFARAGKKAEIVRNVVAGIKTMAKSLPGGLEHALVLKLRAGCEKHLGVPLHISEHEHEH